MNGWIRRKSLEIIDLAAGAGPFGQPLLVGACESSGPVHVDVHVRSYNDSSPLALPAPKPNVKRLPVGTFLDCYA